MRFPRLKHPWVDAGGATGEKMGAKGPGGEDAWMERGTNSLSGPASLPQRKCLWRGLSKQWAREGVIVDREKQLPPKGEGVCSAGAPLGGGTLLCLDLSQSKDELRDYERLCASGEAFVYAATSRLMLRRLARV